MTCKYHCLKCSPNSIYSLKLSSNPGFPTNSLQIRAIVWGQQPILCSAVQSVQVFSGFPCPNSPISSHFPRIAELQLLPPARQKASGNFPRQPTFSEISVLPPEIGDCPQIMSPKLWRPHPPFHASAILRTCPLPQVSISIFKLIRQQAFPEQQL